MSLTPLQKLARRSEQLDAEWSRFNEAQAAREAEIRRPAKHVDVMPDNEYQRIQDTKAYTKNRFKELKETREQQLRCTRNLVFLFFGGDEDLLERDVAEMLFNPEAKKKTAEKEELEKTDDYKRNQAAAKRISEGISAALLMRSQARSDPFTQGERHGTEYLHTTNNFHPEVVLVTSYNSEEDSLSDFAYQLGFRRNQTPGFIKGTTTEIVREPRTGSLAKAVIDRLEKDRKSDQYPTEVEQKILGDFFADETAQKAMEVLLTECAISFNNLAQLLVDIIKIANGRIPENSQPVPTEQFEKPLDQAREDVNKFKSRAGKDYFK